MKRLISGAGAGIVEDWIRKGVLIPAGKRTTRTSDAAQRVKIYREFGSCYCFEKRRSSHRAGFVRIIPLFCPRNRESSSEILAVRMHGLSIKPIS